MFREVEVEVADPAGSETQFGGTQYYMVGNDGGIDVGVVLTILAVPTLVVFGNDDNDGWGRFHPVAVVSSLDLVLHGVGGYANKPERLFVYGSGSQSASLEDLGKEVGAGAFASVASHRMAKVNNFFNCHYFKLLIMNLGCRIKLGWQRGLLQQQLRCR